MAHAELPNAEDRPFWTQKTCYRMDDIVFGVGLSMGKRSLEAARKEFFRAALWEISNYAQILEHENREDLADELRRALLEERDVSQASSPPTPVDKTFPTGWIKSVKDTYRTDETIDLSIRASDNHGLQTLVFAIKHSSFKKRCICWPANPSAALPTLRAKPWPRGPKAAATG
jgi:hypothetical protein